MRSDRRSAAVCALIVACSASGGCALNPFSWGRSQPAATARVDSTGKPMLVAGDSFGAAAFQTGESQTASLKDDQMHDD
jgi:hypothetical protein